MKTLRSCCSITAPLLLACAFSASAASASLFDRMGGAPVMQATVDKFTDLVLADDRINFTFAETDLGKFKRLLYDQLCALSGGPCRYGGRSMTEAHAKLDITTAQFDALTEDLYGALKQSGVPYRLQNKLIALLAPMKREIVKGRHRVAPHAATGDKTSG